MGEYMAADDGPRETMLRDMKYERLGRTLTYRNLRPAIVRYLTSPIRDRGILAECKIALEHQRESAVGQQRENFNHEIRALDAFERSLNALDVQGLTLEKAPAATPLKVDGVSISVQPTAHIRAVRPRGCDLVGAIIIDPAKGVDVKTELAVAKRKEGMECAAMIVHQYVERTFDGQDVKASQPHCVIFHSYRQENVCCPENYKKTLRNIEAVCRNVTRGWDGIVPPNGFNEKEARYRH